MQILHRLVERFLMIISIMKNKKFKKSAVKALALGFWIFVWQIVYMIVGSDIIVASPFMTFARVFSLAKTSFFWLCTVTSISNILIGFLIAVIVAAVLAALSNRFKLIEILFSPIIKLIKATPVASFIILALFWIKNQVPSFIAFLMVVPIVYSNLYEGFKNVDKNLLEMAKIYNFSLIKKIRLIYIPSLMPYFVSAISVGLGFAWKSGIAAEVIGLSKNSLGLEIYNSKIYIETTDLFAYTLVIILLSVIMEKLVMFILKKLSNKVLKGGGLND